MNSRHDVEYALQGSEHSSVLTFSVFDLHVLAVGRITSPSTHSKGETGETSQGNGNAYNILRKCYLGWMRV